MRSDNGGFQHAHKASDTARSVQSHASTKPNPRTSGQSNVTNSIFSQSSASTALTAQSSTESIEPSSNHRDSFGSILDDPFFQTYDPAVDADAASEASEDSSHYHSLDDEEDSYYHRNRDHDHDSDENISNQRWPPPRRESLTVGTSSYWVCLLQGIELHYKPPHPWSRGAQVV